MPYDSDLTLSRLLELIKQQKTTRNSVVKRISGNSGDFIRDLQKGRSTSPRVFNITGAADVLGTTPNYLLGYTDLADAPSDIERQAETIFRRLPLSLQLKMIDIMGIEERHFYSTQTKKLSTDEMYSPAQPFYSTLHEKSKVIPQK